MATDEREWKAVGEQVGAARAGETMWSGPYLQPGERVTVVPKARAEAAEQRVREVEHERDGGSPYSKRENEWRRLLAAEEHTVRGVLDSRNRAEAKLATAVKALRGIDETRNTRILCVRHGGDVGADEPDTCNCGIAIDADKKMRDIAQRALSEIEQGDER